MMLRRGLTLVGGLALSLATLLACAGPAAAQRYYRGGGWAPAYGWNYGYASGYTPYWSGYPGGGSYSAPSYSGYYNPGMYTSPVYGGYTAPAYYGQYAAMNPGYEGAYESSDEKMTDPNAVSVNVRVPADAKVWFDDQSTRQQGTFRRFVSPPVQPGRDYTYDIKAEWNDNGKAVTKTKKLTVHAGDHLTLDMLKGDNGTVTSEKGGADRTGTGASDRDNTNRTNTNRNEKDRDTNRDASKEQDKNTTTPSKDQDKNTTTPSKEQDKNTTTPPSGDRTKPNDSSNAPGTQPSKDRSTPPGTSSDTTQGTNKPSSPDK